MPEETLPSSNEAAPMPPTPKLKLKGGTDLLHQWQQVENNVKDCGVQLRMISANQSSRVAETR